MERLIWEAISKELEEGGLINASPQGLIEKSGLSNNLDIFMRSQVWWKKVTMLT